MSTLVFINTIQSVLIPKPRGWYHVLLTMLRRQRKKVALSQYETAFLLGFTSGTQVSRYERFTRIPTLETALACRILFDTPVHELFPGMYRQAEETVRNNAHLLLEQLALQKTTQHKADYLKAIIYRS